MLDKMNWHHEIEHDHKGWWFWDEDWSFRHGPFHSRQEAERDTRASVVAHETALIVLAELQQIIITAETDFKTIKLEAKDYKDESTARCNLMLAKARTERDKIVLAATRGSEERVNKATQEINSLQNKRDKLLKEITDVQKNVTNLENQMKALKDSLG